MDSSRRLQPAPGRPRRIARPPAGPRLFLRGSILLMASLGAGCIPHTLHRPEAVQRHDDFVQAFVELDDHGELWSPSQPPCHGRALARVGTLHPADESGGELWVGDMSSESLARVSPEGEILLSYTSLRSPPVPGKAVGVQLASRRAGPGRAFRLRSTQEDLP